MAACRLSDFDEVAGTLRLLHTKTGNPRLVAVERGARVAIAQYIVRERKTAPGPLFLGRGGHPLTGWGLSQVVRSLAASAGVACSAHDFRRAAAARWLRQGAPIDVVMSQLGHDDSSMTLIYGSEGRQERAIGVIHDLDAGLRLLSGQRLGARSW